jgi:hypothetical protein
MTAAITMHATATQMRYLGRRTGSLNPANEIFAIRILSSLASLGFF